MTEFILAPESVSPQITGPQFSYDDHTILRFLPDSCFWMHIAGGPAFRIGKRVHEIFTCLCRTRVSVVEAQKIVDSDKETILHVISQVQEEFRHKYNYVYTIMGVLMSDRSQYGMMIRGAYVPQYTFQTWLKD